MTKKYNEIPYFQNEEEEREFWAKHNSTDYLDWDKTNISYFPKLKPTKRKNSLQIPELMLEELQTIANKRDISFQALIKIFLQERIEQVLNVKYR